MYLRSTRPTRDNSPNDRLPSAPLASTLVPEVDQRCDHGLRHYLHRGKFLLSEAEEDRTTRRCGKAEANRDPPAESI